MAKLEKIYAVEFMNYTNYSHDTVCDESTGIYLGVTKNPFLVRESDLPKYQKYGEGYREIKYVGNMEV